MDPNQQQLLLTSGGGKTSTYVDDVFSTYVYSGGPAKSINNGIDLAGEGGLVWTKSRNVSWWGPMVDTIRGKTKTLTSSSYDAESTYATTSGNEGITSFNSNGYSLGADGSTGVFNYDSSKDYASWTFRKAPGFFDIVTYTGNGSGNHQISHNLGSVPGMIWVKSLNGGHDWLVYHVGTTDSAGPGGAYLRLNEANGQSGSSGIFYNTTATNTIFTLGDASDGNQSGINYIAYVFAGGESTAATARSVDFDGSGDTLSIPNNALFNDIDGVDFTMECYAKFDSHGSHDGIIHNVTNSGWGGGSWVFEPVGGRLYFYYYNASGTASVTGGIIPLGQWQHMAITKSGRTITIYQDGIKTGSGTISGNIRTATNPLLIGGQCVGRDMDGKVSNVRITIGQALYTSSFRPPTQPLTTTSQGATASNVKLLCCNNSSVTGSTVTTGTITTNGDPTASTDSPFDDPEGFKFGKEEDQNLIKCGSYKGNGSNSGPVVYLGWEPQLIIFKNINATENWRIYDSMRGIVTGGNDTFLYPSQAWGESNSTDDIELTSTGFGITNLQAAVNGNGNDIIYMAIRMSDGYVGKPARVGTDAFAMDAGGNSPLPSFAANFAADYTFTRDITGSAEMYSTARLVQKFFLVTQTTAADSTSNAFVFDYMLGCCGSGLNSTFQAWMWKRGKGMDVVTYDGNSTAGRELPHSLSQTPEMFWVRPRTGAGAANQNWRVYHKGLNGGTNPEQYYLGLDQTNGESSHTQFWNDTAPTSTHVTLGSSTEGNASNYTYIMMLWASVAGISKCGYYDGNGTGGSSTQTITTGFQPRFILIKRTNSSENWLIFDTVRGWGAGNDKSLKLNSLDAQNSGTWDVGAPTSTGFTLVGNFGTTNASGGKYIYYAHA